MFNFYHHPKSNAGIGRVKEKPAPTPKTASACNVTEFILTGPQLNAS